MLRCQPGHNFATWPQDPEGTLSGERGSVLYGLSVTFLVCNGKDRIVLCWSRSDEEVHQNIRVLITNQGPYCGSMAKRIVSDLRWLSRIRARFCALRLNMSTKDF